MKYIVVFVWAFILAVYDLRKPAAPVNVYGERTEKAVSLPIAILAIIPIVILASFRGNFADTPAYIHTFKEIPGDWAGAKAFMGSVRKDKGFYWLTCFIKVFITTKPTLYLGILAAFQGISLVVFFRRYSSRFFVSVFLFTASAEYISWMCNGLRQFMAVSIILFAAPFILKRRYISAILIILLASTMHQSALIMIPFMFVSMGKSWNFRTLLFIAGVILAIVYVGQFTNLLDDALTNTQYADVISNYTAANDDGTNIFRVLVYSLPALFSFFGRKVIRIEDNRLINLCTNMSIITAGIYFISSVTSGIIIGRIPIYTSLFGYVLLPWEIDNFFNPKSKELLYIGLLGCYILYYFYQVHLTWGLV